MIQPKAPGVPDEQLRDLAFPEWGHAQLTTVLKRNVDAGVPYTKNPNPRNALNTIYHVVSELFTEVYGKTLLFLLDTRLQALDLFLGPL
jgi:hypothetical protein